jgi:hypothetical protein
MQEPWHEANLIQKRETREFNLTTMYEFGQIETLWGPSSLSRQTQHRRSFRNT